MDSMRSLNTSLPGAGGGSPAKPPTMGEPPGHLLQAFRAAALSITTLYKNASDDIGKSRADGYQDALDDLLAFLDKENMGLSDGEGWRIRQWATERLDGRDSVSQHAESDDDVAEKVDGTSSPVPQRSQSESRLHTNRPSSRTASPARTEAPAPAVAPPATCVATTDPTSSLPQQGIFTFRSSHPFPQDADIVLSDLNISDNSRMQSHATSARSSNNPGITITRPSRTSARHNNHTTRHSTRAPSSIGKGAGQKRKAILPDFDFFDLGNLEYGKDGFGGGGKRGRFA